MGRNDCFKKRWKRHACIKKMPKAKKAFLAAALTVCVGSTPFVSSAEGEQSETLDRPNILVIMTEDLNSHFGCFGDETAITPEIDDLSEESIQYTNVYTTAGVCAPSRCSFITGMYQQSIGGQNMRCIDAGYYCVPPEEVKAFPEILRQNGYYTFTEEKLDNQFGGMSPGSGPFTIWDTEYASEELWTGNTEGKPFFGLINMMETHESRLFGNPPVNVVQPEDVVLPPYYPDMEGVRADMAKLYNCVNNMDTQVGKILDRLEEDGLAENTIVIFTADNGDCLPRAKREIYDSGIHVPMLVRYPEKYMPEGAEAGTVDDRMISFVDLAPTFLSWAGVEIPDYMQGQVILDIGDQKAEERQYIYAARDRMDEFPDRQRTVRDERYQYIYTYEEGTPGATHIAFRDNLQIMQDLWACYEAGEMDEVQSIWFEGRPQEMLFDTWNDPYEVNNLADDPEYADELERLRTAYNEWMEETPDLSDIPESEMKESFWPGGVQPVTEVPKMEVELTEDGMAKVTLEEVTPGSSIGYQIKGEKTWHLYTGSLELPQGTEINAKAVRYGYAESGIVKTCCLQPGQTSINL